MAHGIVDAIALAYKAQGVPCPFGLRARSTRSVASSWALAQGFLLTDMCRATSWATPNTVQLSCSEHLYMMGSFQPSYFQLLYLLIAALLECKVATQRPCKQVHRLNINYVQGDSMSISCLTTTHPLESLTVKLRKTNPVQHILNYSDNSPALEHQRCGDTETLQAGTSVEHKLCSGRQYVYFLPNHNPPAGVSDSETTQDKPGSTHLTVFRQLSSIRASEMVCEK
ncbi:uncharacterized protein LOC143728431 [Siphateles boraxobius]|uniref:uncharacterized protein LOC143728431 n=1 Tax=Siphateles boraxobius TaxID=180520 RepID=UPI004062A09A